MPVYIHACICIDIVSERVTYIK